MRFNGLQRGAWFGVVLAVASGGCSVQVRAGWHGGSGAETSPARKPSSSGPAVRTAALDTESPSALSEGGEDEPIPWARTPVEMLRPVKSGPGILICEPVALRAAPELAALGAGCSRWLHLFVGGDGKLGATPLWTAADRIRQEMGRKDLRLTVKETGSLRHTLGITHVALGSVTGSAKKGMLTYRLYSLPLLKAVGSPVVLSGSEEQITAGLPSAARKLAAALGPGTLHVPDRTGLPASDLEFLGRLPWLPDPGLAPESRRRLESLAPRSPLAGFLLLCAGRRNDVEGVAPTVRALLRQAPENALVLGEIGYKIGFPGALPEARTQLDQCRRRYPLNYLFAHCEVWRQRSGDGDPDREYRAAEGAVKSSYENPEAWLSLGWTISDAADRVRKKRVIGKMTPRELEFVDRLYPQWLQTVYQAAKLDPRYGKAWLRVATAGTFAGAEDLADAAFWKAVRYEREDRGDVWDWGMEMYQPKWGGDPAKLEKVARMAMAEYRYDHRTIFVLTALREAKNAPLAAELSKKVMDTLNATLRQHPDDVWARNGLGRVYVERRQFNDAVGEFRKAIEMDPEYADAHFRLARVLYGLRQYNDSIREYQEVIRLDPSYAPAREEMALVEQRRKDSTGEPKPSADESH